MLQAQTHLSIRDMLKYFPITTPKILSRPPAQHCRSSNDTVKYFSLSSSELFKLTFKLQSGAISPISNPGRVLKKCMLERPVLIFYKSQTHSAWYHFSQKRERKHKPIEDEMLAEMQPRDFRESPVKYSTPEQADYLPLSRVSLACLR